RIHCAVIGVPSYTDGDTVAGCMASSSAQAPTSMRRPRFKEMTLDPLSRVIYTQALAALKPLRTTKMEDPQAIRNTVIREHRTQLSTLVSTISAADTEGLNEQQKLALNLGKVTALFSKRLAIPLTKDTHRPPPTTPTVTRKRVVAPPPTSPPNKMKKESIDEDEPCCSSTSATANETLSSLLAAHLESAPEDRVVVHRPIVMARPTTVSRPVTVVRAAPGAAPVKVVVANRNGAAARVVAVRRPVPGQKIAVASRPTVVAPTHSVDSTSGKNVLPTRNLKSTGTRSSAVSTLPRNKIVKEGQLSKRLRIHPDASYGCCEVDNLEKHPTHACPFCGLMVEGNERLEHVKETHPDRYNELTSYICILKECDYRTTSRSAVKAHCLKVHSSLFDQWELRGRFRFDPDTVCTMCPDPFPIKDLTELRMHVRATHDTMPIILCETCCETCTTTSDLFLHWMHSPFCYGKAKLLDCKEESFFALFT
ncbi:hypothetical protein PMAYCL1PPCAC_30098, partial [Pristionchus mayeri]